MSQYKYAPTTTTMKSYLKTKDYSVTKEEFNLIHDEDLHMLITEPHPQNLDKYYASESYISHTDANKTLIDKVYQFVKKYNLSKKVRLVRKFSPLGKTLLDVGAGTGDFLLRAKKANWDVKGVEPNYDARMRAQEKGEHLCTNLGELQNKKFDVITLWHVLEHLPDLNNQIEQLVSILEKEGMMIVAVPNFESYDARHYEMHWAAYDVPRHLWHFSKRAIEKLFLRHGMKLVKIKPMVFDSFYVSLLSEKYKTGKQNYFKAFAVGLLSNLKAWKSREYSSHIYVLVKE